MQALREHSAGGRRRIWPWIAAFVAVVAAGGGGVAYSLSTQGAGNPSPPAKGGDPGPTTVPTTTPPPLHMTGSTPATGVETVPSDTTVSVEFNAPPSPAVDPTISPAVTGSWEPSGDSLVFTPSAPFVPYTTYTVSIPGGPQGVVGTDGVHLARDESVTFTVAAGSRTRLQQLLALLGYLPVSYSEPSPPPPPQELAMPQPGTFAWRWPSLPAQLTSLWVAGSASPLTKGAVMQFETQNGLSVDGLAGPKVWATLLADVAAGKGDTQPYTYVLVTKALPQHLTAWINGALQFSLPVNTGVPGATTTDGTYQVFEHVTASDMKGVNVTGTAYTDPTVPWASYFNGGDALHGYPRATYGWPQSNGCVEMPITTAGKLWPYTPIGTVVTVIGPPAPA